MAKRLTTLLLVLLTTFSLCAENTKQELKNAAPAPLSEEASISLLTSGPSDLAIFTAWGHSAIRVCDPETGLDAVFNYGVFTFGEPISFISRFVSGQTDYQLGRGSMLSSIKETMFKNADYYEQVLNLSKKEKEKLYGMLLENYKLENRTYRYKYFSDNCATRPRELIGLCIDGKLDYKKDSNIAFDSLFLKKDGTNKSYRDLIYELLSTSPWYTFGIDLCLGQPTDTRIENWGQLFLPVQLMKEIEVQNITTNGEIKPLAKEREKILDKEQLPENKSITNTFNPLIVTWTLVLFTMLHALYYIATGKDDRLVYLGFFGLLGLFGTIIFYVSCLSVHEFVFPNYNLLWISPLQMAISMLIYVKKLQWLENILMAIAGTGCILALTYFIGERVINDNTIGMQHFNSATLPSILIEMILISSWLWRHRVNIKKITAVSKKADKKS